MVFHVKLEQWEPLCLLSGIVPVKLAGSGSRWYVALKYQGLSDPSAMDAGIELVITAGLNWCL